MKSKTHLCILAIVALMSGMLAACEGEPPSPTPIPPTPTSASTPTPDATVAPSAGEHVDLGMTYVEQGRLDEAIAEFEEAIRLDPDHADAHVNLGTAYHQQGKFEEAIAELQVAVELEPDDATAYRNLGTAYGEQGQAEEAAAAYEKAIELDPDFGEVHGDLAGVYTRLGRLGEAIAAGEKAVELAPEYAMAYNNLGFAYYTQGMHDEAIAEYQEAIRIDPDFGKAHDNLGVAYMMQGQLDQAIAEFEEAIKVNPGYAGGHVNLGTAYQTQGMHDEAITEYQEAIRINPDLAMPHKNLALLYRDQGRTEEAIVEFETYLQLQPDAADMAAVEKEIARLKERAGAEYRNAAGGYSLRYPEGWYYAEKGAEVTLAPSQEDYQASSLESPLVTFIAWPLAEASENFGLEESAAPAAFLQVMATAIQAETGEIQSAEIGGYPAAFAATSGTLEGSDYRGELMIILVEERLFLAEALAPPDEWEAFGSTFVDMVNSLSFFKPQGWLDDGEKMARRWCRAKLVSLRPLSKGGRLLPTAAFEAWMTDGRPVDGGELFFIEGWNDKLVADRRTPLINSAWREALGRAIGFSPCELGRVDPWIGGTAE